MPKIRILVADDHQLVRGGILTILAAQPDFQVVGEATNGVEAVSKASQLQPDVVLLDISMPELNGLAATPVIRECAPHALIIIVTDHDSSAFARQAFTAGARAFVSKADASRKLVSTIREATLGDGLFKQPLQEETRSSSGIPPSSSTAKDN